MDPQVALAIVNEAKNRGLYDGEMPGNPAAMVKAAERLVGMAKEARDKGAKGDDVTVIIALAENGATASAPAGTGRAAQPGGSAGSPASPFMNLPVPAEIEGEPPEMPYDLTGLDDLAVRRLQAQMQACYSRALWLVAQEDTALQRAKRTLDWERSQVRAKVPKLDDSVTPAVRRLSDDIISEVESARVVVEWRVKVEEHEDNLRNLKALRDVYYGNVGLCERELIARDQEWRRSGQANAGRRP